MKNSTVKKYEESTMLKFQFYEEVIIHQRTLGALLFKVTFPTVFCDLP